MLLASSLQFTGCFCANRLGFGLGALQFRLRSLERFMRTDEVLA
jgi:hypothetical protein